MKTLNEVLSISLIIFVLIFILVFFNYYNNFEIEEEVKILNKAEILEIANNNLDVIKMTSRDAEFVDGPRLVLDEEILSKPALYGDIQGPVYMIHLKLSEKELFVVLNNSDVIKSIPFKEFG